jgi:type II secretory ATPase GspE/PulE/Tfp pilus assembly ATPase PilB-like protein
MNIENRLTKEQLRVCKKEYDYLLSMGIDRPLYDIALTHNFIEPMQQERIDFSIIKEYEIIIISETPSRLTVARKEKLNSNIVKEIESRLHKKLVQKIIPANEFNEKFKKIFTIDTDFLEEQIRAFNDDELDKREVIRIYESILQEAIFLNVSDIHLNEYNEYAWIKYRIDGKIHQKHIVSKELFSRISLIIKESSNLDIVQTLDIQSASFHRVFLNNHIDFRIEIAPSQYGENIVIRVLNKDKNFKNIKTIFPQSHPISKYLYPYLNLKDGFFLVVGPTGSGKSTTLNAMIIDRDRLNESIYTIEDPIEYKIDFVTQYQVNEHIDLSFAKILKSIMRQDPDVIMVGEMRDAESINSALKASHSGHMVYSTLHTKNAFLAIQRIKEENGDIFILANSLSAVIAQRLIPRLCNSCKVKHNSAKAKKFFGSEKIGYKKVGCIKCGFSGLSSRELLVDTIFVPNDTKTKKLLYQALKDNNFDSVMDRLHIFSYYDSAKYLYESGLCDFETLFYELKSLGL